MSDRPNNFHLIKLNNYPAILIDFVEEFHIIIIVSATSFPVHSKLFHFFSALIVIKSQIDGFKLTTKEGRKVQVPIKLNWYKQVKKRGEEKEQVEAEQ